MVFRVGDRVADGGLTGTIVAVMETGEFSDGYDTWIAYLKTGVLVMTQEAGLVHYPDTDALEISN